MPIPPADFVAAALAEGLDLVAIADHDRLDQVAGVVAAADDKILVIPGIEVSTTCGHVLALAPGTQGLEVLTDVVARLGIGSGGQTSFDELTDVVRNQRRPNGDWFRESVVLVGAHADQEGSVLGPNQPLSVANQIEAGERLEAIEVVSSDQLQQWRKSGVKSSGSAMTLIQGSDAHAASGHQPRFTWIYLPEVTTEMLRHALATPEASVFLGENHPEPPTFWIRSVRFESGTYNGMRIEFSPRVTAIIGPPSSGKSLILDAVRYALGVPCAIEDVRSQMEARLAHCLPDGSVVVVEAVQDGVVREIRRVRGGSAVPSGFPLPIVFAQTELTRRAMEDTPAMALLDVHCPPADSLKATLNSLGRDVQSVLAELVQIATAARALRDEVDNPQDGLEAMQAELTEVVGNELPASAAQQLTAVEQWRASVRTNAESWRTGFRPAPGPAIPKVPETTANLLPEAADLLPATRIAEAVTSAQQSTQRIVEEAATAVGSILQESDAILDEARSRIEAALGQELGAATEIAERVRGLRARVAQLNGKARELADIDAEIESKLALLDSLVDEVERARTNLREARKQACTEVNASMPHFFTRIEPDLHTTRLDDALDDLKTGTGFWQDTVREVRDALNRKRLLRRAIRELQGLPDQDDPPGGLPLLTNQDHISVQATSRQKFEQLAGAAVLWPGDGLGLLRKVSDAAPEPFRSLTEGLRALAIKEISFAASSVPVVTDQPEDAVPTASVFDSLVPTIRSQRTFRQFIIASHDANIVVAGDAERVYVLNANGQHPVVGTLFHPDIREQTMTHLEGGEAAFRYRQRRYGK